MPKFLTVRSAIIATLFLLFLIAGAIGGGAFHPDVSAIRELQEARVEAPRMTMVAVGITHFGSAWVTFGGGLLVALWLALRVDRRRGIVLAAAVIGERVILDGLKLLLDRARPAFDAHPVMTHSSSFPSGHSGNSMAVFLAIALIAVPERWRRQAVILAIGLSVVIGLSRPYLGVHWPSDVVGGWSLGAIIALTAAHFANRGDLVAAKQ
jgi:undecaprenyl-diphosphatase